MAADSPFRRSQPGPAADSRARHSPLLACRRSLASPALKAAVLRSLAALCREDVSSKMLRAGLRCHREAVTLRGHQRIVASVDLPAVGRQYLGLRAQQRTHVVEAFCITRLGELQGLLRVPDTAARPLPPQSLRLPFRARVALFGTRFPAQRVELYACFPLSGLRCIQGARAAVTGEDRP